MVNSRIEKFVKAPLLKSKENEDMTKKRRIINKIKLLHKVTAMY